MSISNSSDAMCMLFIFQCLISFYKRINKKFYYFDGFELELYCIILLALNEIIYYGKNIKRVKEEMMVEVLPFTKGSKFKAKRAREVRMRAKSNIRVSKRKGRMKNARGASYYFFSNDKTNWLRELTP